VLVKLHPSPLQLNVKFATGGWFGGGGGGGGGGGADATICSSTGTLTDARPASDGTMMTVSRYVPGSRPAGYSVSLNVSGAVPLESASASHSAAATRCAVHCGVASRLAVEMASDEERFASSGAAETTTRDGVTAITLGGGASKSVPTPQLTVNARPARKARRCRVVSIEITA